jgi:hypothetical protein
MFYMLIGASHHSAMLGFVNVNELVADPAPLGRKPRRLI